MRLSHLACISCRGRQVVLALLLVGFLAAPVSAKPMSSGFATRLPASRLASASPTSAPLPASMIGLAAIPRPAAQIAPTQGRALDVPLSQGVDLTFEELGRGTIELWEPRSTQVGLYLPCNLIPNNAGSYLDLTISHIPSEPDKLCVIRVKLNHVPVDVIALSSENAEPTTYRYYLENTPLTPGRNVLEFSLDTGGWCNVRGARVEVAIHGSSAFHLEYSMAPLSPDLALYPVPFFERSFEYEPVYLVLPHDPSPADLSAAATIAAGLGKFSYGAVSLSAALDAQVSADIQNNHHLIVVGKRGENRLLDQLDLPLALDDPALSDKQGVIQELVSPWNPLRMILVVTGDSDEGLLKASRALNREAHILGMQGPVAIVDAVFAPEPVESRRFDIDLTLANLGYGEEVVYGTSPHTLDYGFHMPLAGAATGEPRLTLYFGHARIASPTDSSLNVYFNDVPMDSIILDESNASGGTLRVSLPSWLVRPGRNDIQVVIEMNLDDEDKCLFLDSRHLWTTIYSHSYFHLPFVTRDVKPALDLFPYPFNKCADLSGVLLVLPDHPRQFDCDLMVEVAAGLGAADQGDYLAIDVNTADLVDQENFRNKDLVLIGRPTAHSLIAELNDSLPQPFEPGLDELRPQLESVVFVQTHSRSIGLIEELAAPWEPERTILVLTGTDDEGAALAGIALLHRGGRLAGNLVVVERSVDSESIDIQAFDTRPLDSAPEGQTEVLDAKRDLLAQLGEWWW